LNSILFCLFLFLAIEIRSIFFEKCNYCCYLWPNLYLQKKKKKEKRKKARKKFRKWLFDILCNQKIEVIWCWLIFIFKGIECVIFSILYPNCSFPRTNSLRSTSFYSFLESTAGWNNTRFCLDLVQLVLKERERENRWGKKKDWVRIVFEKTKRVKTLVEWQYLSVNT